jgi:N-acetylmuramoyl-L-alanine amidase
LNALIQESIGASREVASLDAQSVAEVARFANDNDATLVLSLEQVDELEGVHLHYWASYLSYSHQGEKLASTIASALSQEGLSTRVDLTGMALPILRETRMTTLRVEHGQLPEERLRGLSAVICVVLGEVIHR